MRRDWLIFLLWCIVVFEFFVLLIVILNTFDHLSISLFYGELKNLQTLLGAIIGFSGLAWVTYRNSDLAQRRDVRIAEERLQQRTIESDTRRASLSIALAWEAANIVGDIVSIRRHLIEIIERKLDTVDNRVAENVQIIINDIQQIPNPTLYQNAISETIILSSNSIARLSKFYYDLHVLKRDGKSAFNASTILDGVERLEYTATLGNSALRVLRLSGNNTQQFPKEFTLYKPSTG
ncbi:hypothetical protein [Jiella pelagia]|uniref:Uncharacterized protein n=1 Tax=Jiella pelagia TaxID=2986949 RepID=A0ABY7C2T8_9HYPH|nr:hypothetical protein [Jiella pelagia]WAP69349.1 hypothetical protein OH818_03390 [Jiella pelagia]